MIKICGKICWNQLERVKMLSYLILVCFRIVLLFQFDQAEDLWHKRNKSNMLHQQGSTCSLNMPSLSVPCHSDHSLNVPSPTTISSHWLSPDSFCTAVKWWMILHVLHDAIFFLFFHVVALYSYIIVHSLCCTLFIITFYPSISYTLSLYQKQNKYVVIGHYKFINITLTGRALKSGGAVSRRM